MSNPNFTFRDDINPLRDRLAKAYPKVFLARDHKSRSKPKKLLMVGIREEILARMPTVNPKLLEVVLKDYTTGPSYLKEIKAGAPRHNLYGKVVGAVTEDEETYAAMKLPRERARRTAMYQKFEAKRDQERLNHETALLMSSVPKPSFLSRIVRAVFKRSH